MREQTKFKQTRDSLMSKYYSRKGQNDEEEINVEMRAIEE
jgi:hypothetical protein